MSRARVSCIAQGILCSALPWVSAFSGGPASSWSGRVSSPTRSALANSVQMLVDGERRQYDTLREGMEYRQLGSSDLIVSKVCLGTMTWGNQNTDEEAFEQMNIAFDEFGVNFLDTAEMYPVPVDKKYQGATDKAIAKWLKTRNRDDVVLASKVSGRSDAMTWLRDSGKGPRVRKEDIVESVDKSLKRLGTDHIDLLQVHWPDRYVPLFGAGVYDPSKERDDDIPFDEQLRGLEEVIKAGKVRYIGLSNETPYGISKFITAAEREGLPRVVSVQNAYSLLTRADTEIGNMVEVLSKKNCDVGFLAYSPLAGGVLTGKYQARYKPPDPKARLNLFPGYMARYRNSLADEATDEYMGLVEPVGLETPVQLALAWCYTRPFITSTIIGATSADTLRENLYALNCPITDYADGEIRRIYHKYTDPTKAPLPKQQN